MGTKIFESVNICYSLYFGRILTLGYAGYEYDRYNPD